MISVSQVLNLAVEHHQAGNLYQAEYLYRQILQAEPQHVDALYLLGVLADQVGNNNLAIEYLSAALRLAPNFAEAHSYLANLLMAQSKLAEAAASFQEVLRIQPDNAAAHNNFGNVLREQGKLAEAVASYQQALRLQPDCAAAHNNLGVAFQDLRNLEQAVVSFRQALRLNPRFAEARNNLGSTFREQGKLAEAVASLQEALRLRPDFAEAHNNLGSTLRQQGKLAEAETNLQQALRLKPHDAGAHNNLGLTLAEQGQLAQAVDSFHEALRLKADYAEVHNNLGAALLLQEKPAEAAASLQQALRLKPDFAEAHNNLGNALKRQGNLDDAVSSYQQALRLKPDYAEAHNNLGAARLAQGQFDEALTAYRCACELRPDSAIFHSNVLLMLNYHPGYDAAAIHEECRHWNRQHAEPLKRFIQPHTNHPDPERRLRIGYVSADFRDHVVAWFTVPLLANHDHRQFEIFGYANVVIPDAHTERLRGLADDWRSLVGLTDQQVADRVRGDQIDILVDLTMHMPGNRLLAFARKPAPVQVAWLAYLGTTGLATIDYRLTDVYLDPPGQGDAFYSEESIRLPDSIWCYDPLTDQPAVNALPAARNGLVIFGCLNNFCKVNDGVLALWAKVLQSVPRSRLVLLAPLGQARDRVLAKFHQEGIAASRIECVGRRGRLEYLQLYQGIDVGLDPFPYNGGATTLEAFWMGVPTITLVGKTALGRAGWSQLCNLGLQELAAETPEQYVEIASSLVGDLPRLQELRATLRQRLRDSPLMNGCRFARHMEQAYRQMWRRWCQQTKQT